MTEPAAWGIVDIDGELTVTSPEREDIEASVQSSSGDTIVPLFMTPPKSVVLEPYEEGAYTNRGNIHDLEYYDGPLISAQMCRAKEDVPVIEVAIDNRAAETDGSTVYTRFSKEDLQTMLRMLEDPVVEQPRRCPAYNGTGESCTTCDL